MQNNIKRPLKFQRLTSKFRDINQSYSHVYFMILKTLFRIAIQHTSSVFGKPVVSKLKPQQKFQK